MANVYAQGEQLRVLDWGDSSISHPFASLVVTFRFLEEVTELQPDDPWFARLRDAYLEPWGRGLEGVFALAMRVGIFAHAIAWLRQRDHLAPKDRAEFDSVFPIVLRRAIAQTRSLTALRRRQGPGPDGTRPPTCGRCLPYAPGVVGQMKVLQFAKNVRESSLIIWVAE